jgi:UDP-N-acetylmuramate dehydrogenase
LEAVKFIKEKNIEKIFVVGMGTNLIFTDEYYDGAVIQLAKNVTKEHIQITEEGLVEAFAGVELDDLIKFSFDNNLAGLEWAGGLPGTVGGAVRGNAGAYGGEIKDSLIAAEVLDYSGDSPVIRTLSNNELQFSYRNSFIKQNKKLIVVSAKFNLKKADEHGMEKAREIYNKNIQNRKDKHPLEYPNTGSVFINPREIEQVEKILSVYPDLAENVEKKWYGKVAVASLIDRWGMKGYRVGNAQISEKHALFIVNLGMAKAVEVLKIISDVKKKFVDKFGFELEVEVEIVK